MYKSLDDNLAANAQSNFNFCFGKVKQTNASITKAGAALQDIAGNMISVNNELEELRKKFENAGNISPFARLNVNPKTATAE